MVTNTGTPGSFVDTRLHWVNAAEAGDVNNDGFDDLVVVGRAVDNRYDSLLVYLQNACGSLNQGIDIHPASSARIEVLGRTIIIADVSGDGRNDIVVGDDGWPIIYLQGKKGLLEPPVSVELTKPVTNYIGNVITLDANGDGRRKLALEVDHQVALVDYDNDAGVFVELSRVDLFSGVRGFAAGDLTGDGREDLFVLERSNATFVQVLPSLAAGGFDAAQKFRVRTREDGSLAVGDVTGDGLADVVVAYGHIPPASSIAVLAQKGGTLEEPVRLDSRDAPGRVKIVDTNADGRNDVVVDHSWLLGVYVQGPDGKLGAETTFNVPARNASWAVGDFDGDGRVEVAAAGDRTIGIQRF